MVIPDCHDPDPLSSPLGVGWKSFCCNVFAATQVAERCFGYAGRAFAGRAIAVCTVESKRVGSSCVPPIAAINNLPKEDWIIATGNVPIAIGYRAA